MIHDLKTWPEYYKLVESGEKRFEVRKNDRPYAVGDFLNLREWQPTGTVDGVAITGYYTGQSIYAKVTYILHGGQFGLPENICIMSIE